MVIMIDRPKTSRPLALAGSALDRIDNCCARAIIVYADSLCCLKTDAQIHCRRTGSSRNILVGLILCKRAQECKISAPCGPVSRLRWTQVTRLRCPLMGGLRARLISQIA